ncbi:pteridine-dependent deoxygenase like protein [Lysobacter helvus]|uniref:Pteridine-dependent deoxygenase like protein n=2 Tax=Lysobacteraceae TaxID=32033 RepID=A0ABN6FR83_9GAMM|nr:pteridine-dependent deoxygenase like protein [Lysobacter caseinilyticus]BCT95287.1 pteridine-dependent deoxygenase like protein [Lysobacter helvus]
MSAVRPLQTAPQLHVDYVAQSDAASIDAQLARPDTLAVIGFGDAMPAHADPRCLRVPLQAFGPAPLEVWRARGPVSYGMDGGVRWAQDDALHFGAIEIPEAAGGLEAASAEAYATLSAFVAARGFPSLLRSWNYLDAITEGDDDDERYRRFCIGRAAGLGDVAIGTLPAATAIGRRDGTRTLQVYWLAARTPGTPVENPRQVSAYRYPRRYGPQSPSFARAMLPPSDDMPLLLSGTASVVGHESKHHDCVESQLAETFANFDSLIDAARTLRPTLPARFGAASRLKVYVRDADAMPLVARTLATHLDPSVPRVLLHAAVCRRELRVEIDGIL